MVPAGECAARQDCAGARRARIDSGAKADGAGAGRQRALVQIYRVKCSIAAWEMT